MYVLFIIISILANRIFLEFCLVNFCMFKKKKNNYILLFLLLIFSWDVLIYWCPVTYLEY